MKYHRTQYVNSAFIFIYRLISRCFQSYSIGPCCSGGPGAPGDPDGPGAPGVPDGHGGQGGQGGQVIRWSGCQVVRWSGGQVVRWSGWSKCS